jgi:hypothetical protein
MNVESTEINSRMPLNKVWCSLRRFSRNSQIFLYISSTDFYPKKINIGNTSEVTLTPLLKVWPWMHRSSQNPKLRNGIIMDIFRTEFQQNRPRNTEGSVRFNSRSLSCDRSTASSGGSSPQSATYCFLFQFPLPFRFLNWLRLLPSLPVLSIIPSIFPSITCFTRQFLRKMWPIQLAFVIFIVYRMFLFLLTLCNTSFYTRSVQIILSIFLQHHISKLSRYFWSTFRSVHFSAPHKAMLQM